MSEIKQQGYLFDIWIRRLSITSIVTVIGLSAFSLILWYLLHQEKTLIHLIFALVFTLFTIYYIYKARLSHFFTHAQYVCTEHVVSIILGGNIYRYDLRNPTFLTQCTIRLYIGKGHEDIKLFAITPIRIDQITTEFVGQKAFEDVFHSGGIFLPVEAKDWVDHVTKNSITPEYPKSLYFPSRKNTN